MGLLNLFKKKEKNILKEKTFLDILLDPDNSDNITVYDKDNNPKEFIQVALIYYNNNPYPILEPNFKMEGVGENEVIVFSINCDQDEPILEIETNEEIAEAVFKRYLEME